MYASRTSARRSRRVIVTTIAAVTMGAALVAVPAIAGGDDSGPLADGVKVEQAARAPAALEVPAVPVASANVKHVANIPGATGGHVVAESGRLYVGAYGMGMRIFSLEDPARPKEVGRWVPGPQGPGDPGARADAVPDAAVLDGRHIVALGGTRRMASTTQTEFLDVSNPADPQLLWRFTGAADGEAHNSDIVDERRLWLPSGGSGDNGVRIYDLNPLLEPQPEAPAELFRGNPVELWEASPFRNKRRVGPDFTHVHDIEVYTDLPVAVPTGAERGNGKGKGVDDAAAEASVRFEPRDIALVAEGGSYLSSGNTGSIFVVDITDPEKPVVRNRWMHAHADGHHPIRYFHEAQLLDGNRRVMIVTDEDLHNGCGAGGVTTVELSADLTEAEELAEWFIGTGTPAPMCSSHVFSTQGYFMFMGAYNAGLQVIDLSDPAKPRKAGQHILAGANSWGALVHGDFVYVGDFGARGLDVFGFAPAPDGSAG